MDNFHFDMTAEGSEKLKASLLLFDPPGRRVVGYSVSADKKRLVFYGFRPQTGDQELHRLRS